MKINGRENLLLHTQQKSMGKRFKPYLIVPRGLKKTLEGKFNILVVKYRRKSRDSRRVSQFNCNELKLSTIKNEDMSNSFNEEILESGYNETESTFNIESRCKMLGQLITDTHDFEKENTLPCADEEGGFNFLEDLNALKRETLGKPCKHQIKWDKDVHDIYNPTFSSSEEENKTKDKFDMASWNNRMIQLNLNLKSQSSSKRKLFDRTSKKKEKRKNDSKKLNKKGPYYDFSKKPKMTKPKANPKLETLKFIPQYRSRVRSTNNCLSKKNKVSELKLARESKSTLNKDKTDMFKTRLGKGSKSSIRHHLKSLTFEKKDFRANFKQKKNLKSYKREFSQVLENKRNHVFSVQF